MFSINKVLTLKILPFITALFVLVVCSFWYGASPTQNLVPTTSLSSSPDYFITKISVKEFNTDGLLIETLNAEQTLHYVNQSRTLLEKPNVIRRSNSGSWSAKADKGIVEDGSNDILLTKDAKAIKKHLKSEDVILTADSIHYLDKEQSLTSSGSAMLFSSQGETSAPKITTFINSEKVIMTGPVRGQYETAHSL